MVIKSTAVLDADYSSTPEQPMALDILCDQPTTQFPMVITVATLQRPQHNVWYILHALYMLAIIILLKQSKH